MGNFFDTPVFRGIPKYFPGIGTPDEMSPINDVTHDYENDVPPVIEVSPKEDTPAINDFKNAFQ